MAKYLWTGALGTSLSPRRSIILLKSKTCHSHSSHFICLERTWEKNPFSWTSVCTIWKKPKLSETNWERKSIFKQCHRPERCAEMKISKHFLPHRFVCWPASIQTIISGSHASALWGGHCNEVFECKFKSCQELGKLYLKMKSWELLPRNYVPRLSSQTSPYTCKSVVNPHPYIRDLRRNHVAT